MTSLCLLLCPLLLSLFPFSPAAMLIFLLFFKGATFSPFSQPSHTLFSPGMLFRLIFTGFILSRQPHLSLKATFSKRCSSLINRLLIINYTVLLYSTCLFFFFFLACMFIYIFSLPLLKSKLYERKKCNLTTAKSFALEKF